MGVVGGTTLEEAEKPRSQGLDGGFWLFDRTGVKFVSVGWFSGAETTCDTPYLLLVVFIPLDELCREIEALPDGDLEGGHTVVVSDEVRGDSGVVEIEVGVFVCLQSDIQTVF